MKKRILAMALSLAMLLSLLPARVFAAQTTTGHTEHNFIEVQPNQIAPMEQTQVSPPTEEPEATEEVEEPSSPEAPEQVPVSEPVAAKPPVKAGEATHIDHPMREGEETVSFHTALSTEADLEAALGITPTSTGKLRAGSYVLMDDIYLDPGFAIATAPVGENVDIYLCLNGHTLSFGNELQLNNGLRMHICDCNGSGNGQGRIEAKNSESEKAEEDIIYTEKLT